MDKKNNAQHTIDELASQAGGYFSMPTQEDIAYTDLFFDVCQQFGIRYVVPHTQINLKDRFAQKTTTAHFSVII